MGLHLAINYSKYTVNDNDADLDSSGAKTGAELRKQELPQDPQNKVAPADSR